MLCFVTYRLYNTLGSIHVINYEKRILDFWGQNTGNGHGLEANISRADLSSYPMPILASFPVYGYLFLLHPQFKNHKIIQSYNNLHQVI
jgi:hypothetical protein